jgi:hypothetical protein
LPTTPRPRAYYITGPGNPLPYKRNWYYRMERLGLITLLQKHGGRTLIAAETVDDILSGKIALPVHPARKNRPEPKKRSGRPKKPAPSPSAGKKKPATPPAAE